MFQVLAHITADQFKTLRKALDSRQGVFRSSRWALSAQIFTGFGNAADITLLLQWPSMAEMEAFLQDPAIKALFAHEAVNEGPAFTILSARELDDTSAV